MSDRDLLSVAAAAGAWAGAWWGTGPHPAWGLVAVVPLMVLAAHRVRHTSGRRWVGSMLLLALLLGGLGGVLVAAVRSVSDGRSPLHELAADSAASSSVITVTSDPRTLRDGRGAEPSAAQGGARCVVRVRVESVVVERRVSSTRSAALIFASDAWCRLVPGTKARAMVTWAPPRDPALAASGSVRGPPRVLADPNTAQRWAAHLRSGLRQASESSPVAGAALVPALVVGDESLLPEEVVDDLRGSGLTHLSAVSGANVAIVLAAVLLVARWLGARSVWLTLVGLVTLVGFVIVARPEPSVLRAAVMGAVVVVAAMRGGAVRPVAALAASVLVLVLIDPWLSRAPGFALSVAATAGLVVLVRRWTAGGAGRVRAALLTALAAQIAVAPLIAGLNGRLDVGGILANVLAEPAVAPATVLGFAAAVVAPVHAGTAHAIASVAALPAEWIVRVAGVVAAERWATLPWPAGPWPAVILATLVAAAFVARWVAQSAPAVGSMARPQRPGSPRLRVRRTAILSLGVVVIAVAGLPIAMKTQWPAPGWRMVMCDVGQGDAVVLEAGDGRGILIDAGPDARQIDRCLRDAGVRRLLLVVLTHFHIDHVNGLRGALRDRRVDRILVSPLSEPEAPAREVREVAADAGIPVEVAMTGARAAVGPWLLEVLGPASLDPGEGSPPNNASVVLRGVRDGHEALFLGDAEIAEQRQLLRTVPASSLDVDVVKVAHHGSAVQDPLLVAATRPMLALVSVGCTNRYGHPDAGTLAAVRRSGALAARTDQWGDVAVVDRGETLMLIARGAAATRGPASRC